MEKNHEASPVPSDDGTNIPTSDYLPAYREYWNGRKWIAGEYEELTGCPEGDEFYQGGEDAQSEMDWE